jgi:hypothetical protein
MGQIGAQLTTPNSALISPGGQSTFIGSPSQVLNKANAGLPSAESMLGPDLLHPQAAPEVQQQVANLPKIGAPSFLQAAASGPGGTPNAMSPGLSKGGKLLAFLSSGVQGALAGRAAQEQMIAETGGRRAGGVGTAFSSGYSLPFLRAFQQQQVQRGQAETQIAQGQAKFFPQMQQLGIAKNIADIDKSQAEAGKFGAEAGKATAETGAIPARQALEAAQTEAANFKEDPNLGLIDLRTKQPVDPSAMAPLSDQEAAILGKQPGERVPLKLKNTANEMVNRGIKTTSANGRALLIDNQGKVIKDLGVATPTQNVILSHDLSAQNQAAEETRKRYTSAQDADERLSRMEASYTSAQKGNQQAMLALLSDHIGMTMGLQKGARITKDIIQEAAQSAPWLQRIAAKFDQNGYLTGVTLTPEQMRQMLELGYGARDRAWTSAFQTSQLNGLPEPTGARSIYDQRKQGDMPALQGGAATHSFTLNGQKYENVPDAIYKKYKGQPGFSE